MRQYEVMIDWIIDGFIKWFGSMTIIYMVHFSAYHVLLEFVTILLIKDYVFFGILWQIDLILVFGGMYLIMVRNDIGNYDEVLSIVGEASWTLTIGSVAEPIVS